jgi:hypothetical protein
VHSRFLPLAAIGVLVAAISVRAQQPPVTTPAAAPLVPATAASISALPDRFIGQKVSVYAAAETALSPSVFLLDQSPATRAANALLVVAPTLTAPPQPGTYVTVVGEVMRFDTERIRAAARSYTLDLSAAQVAEFKDRVIVLAQQVYDASMNDLAKPKPVPLTPEEVAFDAVMKRVNPAFGEVRKGLEAGDAGMAKQQADTLAGLFRDTERFFAQRKTDDATRWAQEATSIAESIAAQAAAGKTEDARAAVTRLQALCQSCHSAHRERDEDGQYRVRPGR